MHAPRLTLVSLLCIAPLVPLALSGCDKKEEMSPEERAKLIESKLADADKKAENGQYIEATGADTMLKEAEKLYAFVLEEEENNARALRGMGRLRLKTLQYPGAIDFLKKSIAADGSDPVAHAYLGDALVAQEDHAGAADAYGKAFELNEDNARYGMKQGRALRLAGKLDESKTVLEKVIDIDDQLQYVYTELGDTLRENGDHDEAIRSYLKGQSIYKSDKGAVAGAAMSYEANGKITRALDAWSEYIRLDCCSTYSNDVAEKKLAELEAKEKEAGGDLDAAG